MRSTGEYPSFAVTDVPADAWQAARCNRAAERTRRAKLNAPKQPANGVETSARQAVTPGLATVRSIRPSRTTVTPGRNCRSDGITSMQLS
ncbi:hypothetical protein OKW26_000137 [Paraburkholderia sp. 32]